MKKGRILLIAALGMLLVGCNSEFAKEEYDSAEKIVQSGDKASSSGSVSKPIDEGYSYKASKFNGRETLWKDTLKEDQDVEVECSLALEEGTAKVVYIDAEDNITTLIECTPETSSDENTTVTVPMTSGENRIKIVGYDCKNIELEVHFTV